MKSNPFDRQIAALSGKFRNPDSGPVRLRPVHLLLQSLSTDFHSRAVVETLRFLDALHIERGCAVGATVTAAVIAALLGLAAPVRFSGPDSRSLPLQPEPRPARSISFER